MWCDAARLPLGLGDDLLQCRNGWRWILAYFGGNALADAAPTSC